MGLVYLVAPAIAVEFLTRSMPAALAVLGLSVVVALAWPRPPAFVASILSDLAFYPYASVLAAVAWGLATGVWVEPLLLAATLVIGALAHWRTERLISDPDYDFDS